MVNIKPERKKLKDDIEALIDQNAESTLKKSIELYLQLEEKKKIIRHKMDSRISRLRSMKRMSMTTIQREQKKIDKTMSALYGKNKFLKYLREQKEAWNAEWKDINKKEPKDINTTTPKKTTNTDRGEQENESKMRVVRQEMGVQRNEQVQRDLPGLHEENTDKGATQSKEIPKMTEQETPKVNCVCGKQMTLKNQEMLKQDRMNLEYVCECQNTAHILIYKEEPTYNEIIKDKNGKTLRLETKPIKP